MPEPITYPSTTPILGLPLLFAGQAQKEFFVNQALSIVDGLILQTVIASASTPPAMVAEGECYRVTQSATGAWLGREDDLAIRIGGTWHFVTPADGTTVFDRSVQHRFVFRDGWKSYSLPTTVAGGTTIDAEARTMLVQLIGALGQLGILALPPD